MSQKRTILSIVLFFAVMTAPLFVVISIALFGALYYPRYIEAPIAIFLFDCIFSGGVFVTGADAGIMLPLTFYALLVFAFIELARSKVREGAMIT